MVGTTSLRTAIIYYRVSTEDQAQKGVSLAHQKATCQQYADNHGIKVLKMFHDDGVSAKTADRPGLNELLRYCSKHSKDVDCLIVYKIDRLTRNVNDYSNILVLLAKLKIKLISTTEAVDESAVGTFVGNIMAANAQFDNDVKSERVASCMQAKVEDGYWPWKGRIGYLNTRDNFNKAILTPDPERASFITLIFEWFATGNYTQEEIRQRVHDRGFRTWRGKAVSEKLISRILRSKFYAGIIEKYGKEYQGRHKPLTDLATYYKCQAILSKTDRGDAIAQASKEQAFPLRRFVQCGYCGRPLTGSFSRGRHGGRFPYYRCYRRSCESKKSIAKHKLEDAFTLYLGNISGKEPFLKVFRAIILDVWKSHYTDLNQMHNLILGRIEALKQEKIGLIEMKQKQLLGDDDFTEAFEILKDKINKEYQLLSQNQVEEFDVDEAVEFVFGVIKRLPEVWSEASYDQKLKLQGLIFPEKLKFMYPGFETPRVSPILSVNFAQNEGEKVTRKSLVAPQGIEPWFER